MLLMCLYYLKDCNFAVCRSLVLHLKGGKKMQNDVFCLKQNEQKTFSLDSEKIDFNDNCLF